MIEVLAADLDRIVQNALLYTNDKAIRLREVLLTVNDAMRIYAVDDYVTVTDSCEYEGKEEDRWVYLSIKTLEDLGAWIKKDKKVVHKEKIKITFFNTYLKVRSEAGEIEKFEYLESDNDSAWGLIFDLLDDFPDTKHILEFAVRPERLAKLARLKADKEAPLMFRGIDFNGHLVLQFKRGTTLHGAVTPIRAEYIQEEFLWKNPQKDSIDLSLSSPSTDSVVNSTDSAT